MCFFFIDGALQGLEARRTPDAAARRALAAGGLRGRGAVTRSSGLAARCQDRLRKREKRIMFRRAMKRAMQNAMRLGAQGIKNKRKAREC